MYHPADFRADHCLDFTSGRHQFHKIIGRPKVCRCDRRPGQRWTGRRRISGMLGIYTVRYLYMDVLFSFNKSVVFLLEQSGFHIAFSRRLTYMSALTYLVIFLINPFTHNLSHR